MKLSSRTVNDRDRLLRFSNYVGIHKMWLWLALSAATVLVTIPFVLMFISYLLYRKHYILDEEEYDRICRVIAERKQSV